VIFTIYTKDKDLLERIQGHSTKVIQSMRSLSYEERLARSGLWMLEDRRVRADLSEVYKIIHGVLLLVSTLFKIFLVILSAEHIH